MPKLHRLLPLLVLGALAVPTPALAATQTAHLGNVAATFSFSGSAPNYRDDALTISRAGTVVYHEAVTSKECYSGCGPAVTGGSSVSVLDLEGTGEPDVLLQLWTGGAHCCVIGQVFSYDAASGTYAKTEHDFGDPGYVVRDLAHNGQLEFLTADDRFAYAFGSFASSGLPIQVLTFKAGSFHDVTRSYPALIRKDAARYWKAFRQNYQDGEGLLAAWAADEDMLGRHRFVARTLTRQLHAGHLHSLLAPTVATGKRYIHALNRFLRKLGYQR